MQNIIYWVGLVFGLLLVLVDFIQVINGKEASERFIAFICTVLQCLVVYLILK